MSTSESNSSCHLHNAIRVGDAMPSLGLLSLEFLFASRAQPVGAPVIGVRPVCPSLMLSRPICGKSPLLGVEMTIPVAWEVLTSPAAVVRLWTVRGRELGLEVIRARSALLLLSMVDPLLLRTSSGSGLICNLTTVQTGLWA